MRSSSLYLSALVLALGAGCAYDWDHLRPTSGQDQPDGGDGSTDDGPTDEASTDVMDATSDARTDAPMPRTDGTATADGGDAAMDHGGPAWDASADAGTPPDGTVTMDIPGTRDVQTGMDLPVGPDVPVRSDVPVDHGPVGTDTGVDAGMRADTGVDTGPSLDTGVDSGTDTGAGVDTGPGCMGSLCACAPGNTVGYCPIGGTCTAAGTCVGSPGGGSLVITEFMNYTRAVVDDAGEWLEVYNPGPSPVDLRGLRVGNARGQYTVLAGMQPLLVASNGYGLIARNSDPSVNGGLPPVTYAMNLPLNVLTFGNTNGGVSLDTGAGTPVIDQVYFDSTSWPNTRGHAKSRDAGQLDTSTSGSSLFWCNAPTQWSGSAGDYGSPGLPNPPCF